MTWKMRGEGRGTIRPYLAVYATLLLAGCGRVPGQFLIVQDQVPSETCTIPGELSAVYRPEGTLDVKLVTDQATVGYALFPLLENDLPRPTTGQLVDGNRIALAAWSVSLEPLTGSATLQALFGDQNASLVQYNLPTSGSVASGGGLTPSFVDAFPPDLARQVRATGELRTGDRFIVQATVHALGDRINGSIQSDDFHFPITVCEGCLIGTQGMCPFRSAPANPGNPCNPAQDQTVDCCLQNGNLICPPLVVQ